MCLPTINESSQPERVVSGMPEVLSLLSHDFTLGVLHEAQGTMIGQLQWYCPFMASIAASKTSNKAKLRKA